MTSAQGQGIEMSRRRPRLGAVSFLNAAPLVCGLDDKFDIVLREPARLGDDLLGGHLDAALIPVASLLRPEAWSGGKSRFEVLPRLGIAAAGHVQTVLLVGEVPWSELEEIALDGASRTSALLVELLSKEQGFSPKLFSVAHDQAPTAAKGKRGSLVIGDAAFFIDPAAYGYVYDLGKLWYERVGLPFVFAVWAAPTGRLSPSDVWSLEAALEDGLRAVPTIAAEFAAKHGGSTALYERYLLSNIRHRLGYEERAGLAEFFSRVKAAGLAPSPAGEVKFWRAPKRTPDGLTLPLRGERLGREQAIALYDDTPLGELGAAAHEKRQQLHSDPVVTYIVDRNINYTNVCVTRCKFCNFYRPPGHAEGYVLSKQILAEKMAETVRRGGVQILLQGGLNPELRLSYYEDLFRWIKDHFPLNLHALSPAEITHLATLEGLTIRQVLERLVSAGLDSVPGGGAEILDDVVRHQISPLKCTTDEWLEVMRQAHGLGLRSSASLVFGFGETPEQLVDHLLRIRSLQDETGGFIAFICWPFQSEGTRLRGHDDTSASRYLRVQALGRLVLGNIENVQASWPTMGPDVAQMGLYYGANDFGSVMMEENVVSTAGAHFQMTSEDIERYIRRAGFVPSRRNQRYERIATSSATAAPATLVELTL